MMPAQRIHTATLPMMTALGRSAVGSGGAVLVSAAGIGLALTRADDEPGTLPPGTVVLRLSF